MQCADAIGILLGLDEQVSWFELVNLGWYFCNALVIACISASIFDL